ncbi:MAG: hypothetical protein SFT90_07420 [Rickettsiales bacterium]|nr:hypothetical protein [Rickettsiales bacterium]
MAKFPKKSGLSLKKIIAFIREKARQSPHLTKSLIAHFILILLISGAIPSCTSKPIKPKVVEVNIMPMADKINPQAKPQAHNQKPKPILPKKVEPPKPKPKPKEPPKPVEQPKPKPKPQEAIERKKAIEPPQPKKADAPSPKKDEVKPEIKPLPEVIKKQEVNKDKEDQAGKKSLLKDLEKKEESLDDLFGEIEKKKEEIKEAKPQPKTSTQAPNTANEDVVDEAFVRDLMQKIQSQISRCWSIPIGAKDVGNMQVTLYIKLDSAGNVLQVKIMDSGLYNSDQTFRVVADSAVWAVKDCSPLQGLPTDKYKFWQEIEFNFNPALMAN